MIVVESRGSLQESEVGNCKVKGYVYTMGSPHGTLDPDPMRTG